MTIKNIISMVSLIILPLSAWDYSFTNGYTQPVEVDLKTRSNRPWDSTLLMPGEKHTFSTGGLCLDGLKVEFGGTVNPQTEEMVGGEVLETHPGFRAGKIDTLPTGAFGLYCGNFDGLFSPDTQGALTLAEVGEKS